MNGTKFLMDTNVVLYLLNGDKTVADLINDKQIYVSFITELELLGYQELTEDERKRIIEFLSECTIININRQIKERTIQIRQHQKIKLPDSIIAATSQYLNIPLISSDADFKKVEGISVVVYEM